MAEKIMGWTCYETIGISVINTRAVAYMRSKQLKGWTRLYTEVLKYGMAIEVMRTQEDGTYIIETKKVGSSYWSTRHVLEPGKEVIQDT